MFEIRPDTLSKAFPLGKNGKKKKKAKMRIEPVSLQKGFSVCAEPVLESRANKRNREKYMAEREPYLLVIMQLPRLQLLGKNDKLR